MKTVRQRYNRCLLLIHLLTEVKFLVRNTLGDKTNGCFLRRCYDGKCRLKLQTAFKWIMQIEYFQVVIDLASPALPFACCVASSDVSVVRNNPVDNSNLLESNRSK